MRLFDAYESREMTSGTWADSGDETGNLQIFGGIPGLVLLVAFFVACLWIGAGNVKLPHKKVKDEAPKSDSGESSEPKPNE